MLDGGEPDAQVFHIDSSVLTFDGSTPIAGATVCVVAHPEIACATSGTDGTYSLSVPAWTTDVDLAVNATAAGYLGATTLLHERAGQVVWASSQLLDDAAAAALMKPAGIAYPSNGKGIVLLSVWGPLGGAATGMTVSASPAGGGPVYLDAMGNPDPTLTAIGTDGYVVLGDLEPGPIEIAVSDASCVPAAVSVQEWPDAKPATISGVTVADSLTQMIVACQ